MAGVDQSLPVDQQCGAWLPILTKRLDAARPRIELLRSYREGDAPLPELTANTRAGWQKFQRESRTNWADSIITSVADRIVPLGIQVAGSTESDEARRAQHIWRDNRMEIIVPEFVRDGLAYSNSYLLVSSEPSDDGPKAIITAEGPQFVYASTDPLRSWIVRAAVKVWRDDDAKVDYAQVWVVGGRTTFWRPARSGGRLRMRTSSRDWQPVEGSFRQISGDIPVYPYQNPGGFGDFEQHLDLINRINRGILQRITTTAMQAFRQRALQRKEQQPGYGTKDDDEGDDDVDYTEVFEYAPGALWELPEGWNVWESTYTDITPMLTASKDDLRELAGVTRTPLPMLIPDGANQSAMGATQMASGLYFKARERLAVAKITLAAAMLKAMRVEGVEPSGTIQILCEDPERVTLTEKYAAAAQAKTAGESWKSIQRNILGRSPDQIRQDAQDHAAEQLAAALLSGSAPQPASARTQ